MFLCDLQRLIHALTNGNTWNDYDKLAPAVSLVQLVHGLDVGIRFSDTCFHFDRQVEMPLQLFRRLDLIGTLNFLQVFQNHFIAEFRDDFLICPACELLVGIGQEFILIRPPVDHIGRCEIGLSCENVNDCLCGICLKFLMLELQFHYITSY